MMGLFGALKKKENKPLPPPPPAASPPMPPNPMNAPPLPQQQLSQPQQFSIDLPSFPNTMGRDQEFGEVPPAQNTQDMGFQPGPSLQQQPSIPPIPTAPQPRQAPSPARAQHKEMPKFSLKKAIAESKDAEEIFEENVEGDIPDVLYIKVPKYRQMLDDLNKMKGNVKESSQSLKRLVEINDTQEKELKTWEDYLQQVQTRLNNVENILFE